MWLALAAGWLAWVYSTLYTYTYVRFPDARARGHGSSSHFHFHSAVFAKKGKINTPGAYTKIADPAQTNGLPKISYWHWEHKLRRWWRL